jgi:hypothetical protein
MHVKSGKEGFGRIVVLSSKFKVTTDTGFGVFIAKCGEVALILPKVVNIGVEVGASVFEFGVRRDCRCHLEVFPACLASLCGLLSVLFIFSIAWFYDLLGFNDSR